MKFYDYRGICLYCADNSVNIPKNAHEVNESFSPIAILINRDPMNSRSVFPVLSGGEVYESEGVGLFLPCAHESDLPRSVLDIVAAGEAFCVNTAFPLVFDGLSALRQDKKRFTLTLVGLGDVGATVLLGLKLLGSDIDSIRIYDPNEALCARYEAELNQILPMYSDVPKVEIADRSKLFDCDAFLFTASVGVPPVTENIPDVRMFQYARNRAMLKRYAIEARESGFSGLFAQISDPVDHLSRAVFIDSNTASDGTMDFLGLLPEQIQGYGLGVMRARAEYTADKIGVDRRDIRVYGPHGNGLIVANSPNENYDDDISLALTEAARTANLRVRELGFKPYIAPGISSACVSIIKTLRGQWHWSAVPMGGGYVGCESRFTQWGIERRREKLSPKLTERLTETFDTLRRFDYR